MFSVNINRCPPLVAGTERRGGGNNAARQNILPPCPGRGDKNWLSGSPVSSGTAANLIFMEQKTPSAASCRHSCQNTTMVKDRTLEVMDAPRTSPAPRYLTAER